MRQSQNHQEPDTHPALQTKEFADYPPVLTVQAAARLLDLHPNTVYRMVRRGELQAGRCGKVLRISRDAVQKVLRGAHKGDL